MITLTAGYFGGDFLKLCFLFFLFFFFLRIETSQVTTK